MSEEPHPVPKILHPKFLLASSAPQSQLKFHLKMKIRDQGFASLWVFPGATTNSWNNTWPTPGQPPHLQNPWKNPMELEIQLFQAQEK